MYVIVMFWYNSVLCEAEEEENEWEGMDQICFWHQLVPQLSERTYQG